MPPFHPDCESQSMQADETNLLRKQDHVDGCLQDMQSVPVNDQFEKESPASRSFQGRPV